MASEWQAPDRKIFADANVLIAGADSDSGASHVVLRLAEAGFFTLVVSRQVLDEAERNLRKKLPRALPNFAIQMSRIRLEIVPDPGVDEVRLWEPIIETKDAPILAAAVAANVDRLLTLNTKDFTPEVANQCGLIIQTPGEFIQEIRHIIRAEL
ncbi:MAG: PIN domain-containing protein [Chloroflexi bacterium]|nr:PIN domain-containing protein [Chloroflexota bacterium]